MRILGIDPALNNTGWAILDVINLENKIVALGHISNRQADNYYDKVANIFNKTNEIIEKYQPQILAIEETFVNNNAASSLKLGVVRGIFFSCAVKNGLKIYEFKPNEIKKAITGNGKADKVPVEYMVKMLLPKATPRTPDESDAIAIALTCAFEKKLDDNCRFVKN